MSRQNNEVPPRLLTADEVCERLQVSKQFVYAECRRAKQEWRTGPRLKHVRIGREIRVKPDDLAAYIEAHRAA